MRGVLVSVEEPKGLWCHQMSQLFPELDVRVTSLVPCRGDRFVETVELRGSGADQAVRRLSQMAGLDYVVPIEVAPHHALVRIGVRACPLVNAMRDTAAVPHLPFTVENGEDRWLIAGDPEEGHRLLTALAGSGLERRVLRAGDWHAALDDLTELQRETLEAAVRLGYYEYPRGISLTDLAKRRGVAKSTISQTLRIVEKKIMATHVARGTDGHVVHEAHATTPLVHWTSQVG